MPGVVKGSNKGPLLLSVLGQLRDGTPGVVKGLHLFFCRSSPGVLRSASLALAFWYPVYCCAGDVTRFFPIKHVPSLPSGLLLMMMVSILSWWQRASSCSFEMLLGQKILRIHRGLFVWKTESLLRSLAASNTLSRITREKVHSSGTASAWFM